MLVDTNVCLVICGAGDAESEILDYAKKDERIVFKGQIPRNEVLKITTECKFACKSTYSRGRVH